MMKPHNPPLSPTPIPQEFRPPKALFLLDVVGEWCEFYLIVGVNPTPSLPHPLIFGLQFDSLEFDINKQHPLYLLSSLSHSLPLYQLLSYSLMVIFPSTVIFLSFFLFRIFHLWKSVFSSLFYFFFFLARFLI